MSLDRALGDVQVASDFGIVTALEQEIDDLLFAGSHGSQRLVHFTSPQKPRWTPQMAESAKSERRGKTGQMVRAEHARSHSRITSVKKL